MNIWNCEINECGCIQIMMMRIFHHFFFWILHTDASVCACVSLWASVFQPIKWAYDQACTKCATIACVCVWNCMCNLILCWDPCSITCDCDTHRSSPRSSKSIATNKKEQPYDNANDSSCSFSVATAAELRSIQLICLHIFMYWNIAMHTQTFIRA